MAESVRRRVFDPFFTTKGVGKGTGQGLSLAHNVVVGKHHGQLEVTSSPGHGARFTIRLPLHPPAPRTWTPIPPGEPGPAPGAGDGPARRFFRSVTRAPARQTGHTPSIQVRRETRRRRPRAIPSPSRTATAPRRPTLPGSDRSAARSGAPTARPSARCPCRNTDEPRTRAGSARRCGSRAAPAASTVTVRSPGVVRPITSAASPRRSTSDDARGEPLRRQPDPRTQPGDQGVGRPARRQQERRRPDDAHSLDRDHREPPWQAPRETAAPIEIISTSAGTGTGRPASHPVRSAKASGRLAPPAPPKEATAEPAEAESCPILAPVSPACPAPRCGPLVCPWIRTGRRRRPPRKP